jgi:L-alanine-DL-glutamate epimerase-like enolase superfamily enzyme
LTVPFKTALRTVTTAESLLVRLSTDTGQCGWGEAPATAAITGDSLESMEACLLSRLRLLVLGADIGELGKVTQAVRGASPTDFNARAAVDVALWDLAAQRAGIPLFELLGGAGNRLETDFTVSVAAPDAMAQAALLARERGFSALKVKLGGAGNLEVDLERFRRIRQRVGSEIELRVDANQAWRELDTERAVSVLAGLGAALLEQPVAKDRLDVLARITRTSPLPIVADESVFGAADALKVVQLGAAHALNIKLTKAGGISEALDIAAVARAASMPYMVGSMIESRVGITAAAHFAAGQIGVRWVDMDAPLMLAEDPVRGGVEYAGPRLELTRAPGLGIRNVRLGLGIEWRNTKP